MNFDQGDKQKATRGRFRCYSSMNYN
jgi:hypothetical protein